MPATLLILTCHLCKELKLFCSIGELFLSNHRVNSMAGIVASDAAVVASIALQYGVPVDVIRNALMRDSRGRPSGPLGVVLDKLAAEEGTA
jgi:ribonucleoside-diphosphate reductase alpha chain